jgi:prepilin signal peptidase PulO-like enzyme (type II secretory pathway)
LIALWIWCFGANVGSFMNVVIFRVPEGLSVVYPGSRCPKCLNHIRWYDNIPVISWLLLRAKCRYCSLPISSRYPTIEALVAGVFLVIAFAGPPTSGANLPYVLEYSRSGTDVSLWVIYAFHMLLVTTIICAAMVRYDGHLVPWRLYAPGLTLGLYGPFLWAVPAVKASVPYIWLPLHPVSFTQVAEFKDMPRVLAALNSLDMSPALALLNSLAGLGVGLSLGWLVAAIGKPG